MEANLDRPVPTSGVPEIDRICAAINRLARALQENKVREADLEKQLRHADRLAVLGRLVAGVAHEVRNPLASIKLRLDLARDSADDPSRVAAAFEVIRCEVERLDRLVQRLLALGKPSESTPIPTDLRRLLAERLELWQSRAAAQGTTVHLRSASSLAAPAPVDRDRVGQIIDNLMANALDALADRGGEVTVEAAWGCPGEVVVSVTDTGPGVPTDLAERIFEPFFTTRDGGTGLGLFLSAEMARRLGGDLRHRPRPGGGSCFEVRLPC